MKIKEDNREKIWKRIEQGINPDEDYYEKRKEAKRIIRRLMNEDAKLHKILNCKDSVWKNLTKRKSR